ncbi:Rad3-related DNA helicase [Fructobacillus fructosus]|uniref:exonuclease domain-containing protein n=1 Tax=Fructobacillus fructosus TaxID=1631 RepID=UPI00021954F1|nr:exonuclease domain-containing protein [Fructobacillus fructosus]KRN51745.1 Rad3-related DNA helicase [Fructobacillus fructosus KCTC 3544]GAP01522.1 Rad3-related DNA helicase [Fructobacillus fructosus]
MKESAAFVIVDLETTSPSVENGGRIIQIGMTFVKNKKIVEHFDSFVNPAQPIDRKIQQLTHISPSDVQDAPFFEELAPSLQALLQGQVFVAHNVNFDLPYLNAEFARVGLPELDLQAIDTVQLAQILFPTAPGYRLSDLTTYLDLPLTQAHRANADAEATAYLMLALWQKAQSLPEKTKRTMLSVDWGLIRQSQDFLKMAAKSRGAFEKRQLVARVRESMQAGRRQPEKKTVGTKGNVLPYPQTVEEKKRLFGPDLEIDEQRNNFMNRVFRLINGNQHELAIMQTEPQLKKTLAYLLPLLFTKKRKTKWLLTDDLSLIHHQKQLLASLTDHLPAVGIRFASLYQPSDYLDEQKFRSAIKKAKEKGGMLWQAQVLVWLSESPTAAFAELPRGIRSHPDLLQVAADEESAVFRQAYAEAKQADILLAPYQTFFSYGKAINDDQQRKERPAVILEKPIGLQQAIQESQGLTLTLGYYQDQVARLADQAAQLPAKKRGVWQVNLHNWSVACQKIDQNLSEKEALKASKAILDRLITILDLAKKVDFHCRLRVEDLLEKRSKLAWLAAHQECVKKTYWTIDDERAQQSLTFEVDESLLYQKYFVKLLSQLVTVSAFYPSELRQFLATLPAGIKTSDFDDDASYDAPTHQLKAVLSAERNEDKQIQALFESNRKHFLFVVDDFSASKHWYYKLSNKYGDDYMVYGQDLSAPLKKAAWQASGEEQSILVATPAFLKELYEQSLPLPEVVVLPRANRWLSQEDLLLLVTAMMKNAQSLLIASLSQKQEQTVANHLHVLNGGRRVAKVSLLRKK